MPACKNTVTMPGHAHTKSHDNSAVSRGSLIELRGLATWQVGARGSPLSGPPPTVTVPGPRRRLQAARLTPLSLARQAAAIPVGAISPLSAPLKTRDSAGADLPQRTMRLGSASARRTAAFAAQVTPFRRRLPGPGPARALIHGRPSTRIRRRSGLPGGGRASVRSQQGVLPAGDRPELSPGPMSARPGSRAAMLMRPLAAGRSRQVRNGRRPPPPGAQ